MLQTVKQTSVRTRLGVVNFFTNPVAVKELRGYWRNWRNILSLSGYILSLGWAVGFAYVAITRQATSPLTPELFGNIIFITLTIWQLFAIAVSTNNASSIVNEKERQTYDALLITLLRPRDIVIGKLLASMTFSLLLVVAGLPFEAIAFALGGADLDVMLAVLALCLATAFLYGAVNLYASSMVSSSRRANSLTALITFFLLGILPGALYITRSAMIDDELTRYLLTSLSAPLAIVLSAIQLYDPHLSSSLFFTQIVQGSVTVPMPWLVCIVESIMLGCGFVALTTTNLKPGGWSYRFESGFVTLIRKFALIKSR